MSLGGADPVGRGLRLAGIALLGCFALLVLLLLAVGVQAVRLRGQVAQLRADLRAAQATAAAGGLLAERTGPGEVLAVRHLVATVQADTHRMRRTTDSLPWRLTRHLPGLAGSLQATSDLTAAGDSVSHDVLPTLAWVVIDLRARPRTGPLDVRAVTERQVQLREASVVVSAARLRLARGPRGSGPVAAAHAEVLARLDQLQAALDPLLAVAQVGGGMTGQQGPRSYLVVLQSPAESRATGGIVGGFLQLEVRDGGVRVVRTGTNHDLDWRGGDVVRVAQGFAEVWGQFGAQRLWSSSNLSLDLPSVAQVWGSLYARQYGVPLDGVVGITPEALSPVLALTGPLPLPDGSQLNAGNAAALLEVDLYRRFPRPEDETVRNAFQLAVLQELSAAVLRVQPVGPQAFSALGPAVAQGAFRLASFHPQEQAVLAGTAVGGALPRDGRPFVAWTTQNVAGTKLDVYLHRSLDYRRVPVGARRERVVATARVRNDAPVAGLPPYVTIRADLDEAQRITARPGVDKLLVTTYLTAGARITSVTLDGRPAAVRLGTEQGHPVAIVEVLLQPGGGEAVVAVTANQPSAPGPVSTLRQPVPRPDELTLG